MHTASSKTDGLAYLALGVSVLGLGMSAILVRWADVPGPVNGFYRMLFAALLTAPLFARERLTQPALSRAGWGWALLAGLFFAADLSAWNTSVMLTSAANATFLGNTSSIWVGLFAWLILRERLPGGFWLGLLAALGGVALMLGEDFLAAPEMGLGGALALIAGFFYGCFFIVTQRARAHLPAFGSWWISALGSLAGLLAVSVALGLPLAGYALETYGLLLALALLTQVLGYLLVNFALGRLPASVVAPTLLAQPVVTAIYGVFLLHEPLSFFQILGGALVLVGIALVNRRSSAATA